MSITLAKAYAVKLWQFADDVIQQAGFSNDQVKVRRSISTCYYSAFHLTTRGAASHLYRDQKAIDIATRAFTHTDLFDAYLKLSADKLQQTPNNWNKVARQFHDSSKEEIVTLKTLADGFVHLYKRRLTADYDFSDNQKIKASEAILCASLTKNYIDLFTELHESRLELFERLISILLFKRQSHML